MFPVTDRSLAAGPAVRPEYLKLPNDLAALACSFGIVLPEQLQRDAAVLTLAIECADRFLDDLPEPEGRARFSAGVLACLRGEPFAGDAVPLELTGRLAQLKDVGERHGLSVPFRERVAALLANSERMRTTRSQTRYVVCAVREGRLMVELLLGILAGSSTPAFELFLRQLSAPANLGDKLRDARRDFERGEIALRPTCSFRARLVYELCRRTVRLACDHLANWRLAVWGIQSVFTELLWFPFSRSHSH